ncbi:MAG: HAD family hydrolase [Candidatus Levyibacteriota bacterium]
MKRLKYKALIFDVDGTLIVNKKDGFPSIKTTIALKKAGKILHTGIASSRPYFLLSHIFDHLRLSGPSIINGGTQIIDLDTGKILWEKLIEKNDFMEICQIFKKEKIPFFVHDGRTDVYKKQESIQTIYNVVSLELSPFQMNSLLKKLNHLPNISAQRTPDWKKGREGLLISHAVATKQYAILKVAELLKIQTHEIIGVGDGYNDFPLLMACGLRVAMGNAVSDLKEIADYIAPSVEEDGLADVINKFIL